LIPLLNLVAIKCLLHALSSLRRERRFQTNRRQAFVALAPFLPEEGAERDAAFMRWFKILQSFKPIRGTI